MRNINTVINEYYETFESSRGLLANSPYWVISFVVTCILALYTSIMMLDFITYDWVALSRKTRFILFLVGFLAAFSVGIKLVLEKNKLNIKRAQKFLQSNESKLYRLKAEWFEACLAHDRSEYLKLAESLDKVSGYREKYKSSSDFSAKDIAQFIFADDSKPRVLAMFLMLSALVATLSVREEASLTTVLDFYWEATAEQLFLIFVYFPTGVFIGYLEIKYFLIGLARGAERFFESFNGKNAFSKRRTHIFIKELIRECSLEKPRVRYNGMNLTS